MPPRKKVVKRTVRKAAPKSKASASPITPSPPPPTDTVADTDNDTSVTDATTTDPELTTPEVPAREETPTVEPLAVEEAAAAEEQPAVDEAPAEEPAPDVAREEERPAADEPPAEGLPAEVEAAADEEPKNGDEEETKPPEAASSKKTTKRVRKVVKKRIVVKKVPKASIAAATDVVKAGDEEAAASTAPVEEISSPKRSPSPKPSEQPEPEIVGSGAAADVGPQVEKMETEEVECAADVEPQVDKMETGGVECAADVGPQVEKIETEGVECAADVGPQVEKIKTEGVECAADVGPQVEKVGTEEVERAPMEEDKIEGGDAEVAEASALEDEERGISERRRRRKTEIFIGGLDRDAKEEDIKKVFGLAGEIVEVRMMMDSQTGKNKGFCFLRYAEAAQAKKAVLEFHKVEICGKLCGAAALEGNDTIFLGSIDKKWKKEDVVKLLQEIGIEKIDTVTVMADPKNAVLNRGFAFLELETNRDAQIAFKKLQKKDAFGKGRNVKVAWAEPLNDPDEEEMQKVKSVYVEGIPINWDEEKMRATFKKFGEIDRVVLARNMRAAKRKDFAFVNYATRESALSCVELFDKEDITDNGSKVNLKVSLAKPVQKGKQNKGALKPNNKDNIREKPKAVFQRDTKGGFPSSNGKPFKAGYGASGENLASSTPHGLLQAYRHQVPWKEEQAGYARAPPVQDYGHALAGEKRNFSAMGDNSMYSDYRGYPRARLESSYPSAGSSYGTVSHGMPGPSLPYFQQPNVGYTSGYNYGAPEQPSNFQMRQGPYGSGPYPRY